MNRKKHCPTCTCAEHGAQPPDPVPGARWIPLSRGYYALVDEDDYERVAMHSWFMRPNKTGFYAAHWGKIAGHDNLGRNMFLHHFILGVRQRIDHKNGNGLDNRRDNLRPCNTSQNMANRRKQLEATSSRFKGVCWNKKKRRWIAYINARGERSYLGMFEAEESAARAYDAAARRLHGEFARLNLPQENA